MNKFLKIILVFALAAVLIVVGVFAAANLKHESSATITFSNSETPLTITGKRTGGATPTQYADYSSTNYTVNGASKTRKDFAQWELGEIALNSGDYTFAFELKFKNEAGADEGGKVKIDITRPVLTHANLRLTVSGTNVTAGSGETIVDTATIDKGGEVTFKYLLVLTDYSTAVTSQDFNFSVTFTLV